MEGHEIRTYLGMDLFPFMENGKPAQYSEAEFQRFLAAEKITLPQSYLNLLRATNGGRIAWKQKVTFSAKLTGQQIEMWQFNPSSTKNKWEGLEGHRRTYKKFLPDWLFFFGAATGDRMLHITVSGPHQGAVISMNECKTNLKKESKPEDLEKAKGVLYLCDSFDNFIAGLTIMERQTP